MTKLCDLNRYFQPDEKILFCVTETDIKKMVSTKGMVALSKQEFERLRSELTKMDWDVRVSGLLESFKKEREQTYLHSIV